MRRSGAHPVRGSVTWEGLISTIFSGRRAWLIAIGLALGHAMLATVASENKSITADETGYVVAGEVYNRWNDFRMQPENGNLPQRWMALPVLFSANHLPSTADPAWVQADVWNFGFDYLYGSGFASGEYLFLARGMTSLFGAALALAIFAWSAKLFGPVAGLFSEGLFVLSPSFLAHSGLATSDVAMSFFLLVTTWAFAEQLASPV